jgi:hypothetical protein
MSVEMDEEQHDHLDSKLFRRMRVSLVQRLSRKKRRTRRQGTCPSSTLSA